MQNKHTKGLFINSSYRRAGILKTLLQGLRREQDTEEAGDGIYEIGDRGSSSDEDFRSRIRDDKTT